MYKCSLREIERFIFEKHRTYMNGFYLPGAGIVGVLEVLFNLLTDNIVPGCFLHGIKNCVFTSECVSEGTERNMRYALRLMLHK